MVTISLVHKGITSATCLCVYEYYLYSAYEASRQKDKPTEDDLRLMHVFVQFADLVVVRLSYSRPFFLFTFFELQIFDNALDTPEYGKTSWLCDFL